MEQKHFFGFLFLISLNCFLLLSTAVVGQTYQTRANGNWSSTSTWQGGVVPPTGAIPASTIINIRHTVTYNSSNNIDNEGTIRVQPITGTTARLNLPSGINFENQSTGKLFIINGAMVQFRFAAGNDGQPYSGTNPTGIKNSGTLKNVGGYVYCENFISEIAQDWVNDGGTRIYKNGCIYTGQNFSMSGSGAVDSLINVRVSIGWHGSGSYASSDGRVYFSNFAFQLAGTSGGFELNSGIANGDIDYIFLRNQHHPSSYIPGTSIDASSSLIVNDPSTATVERLNLDAYCTGGGGFNHNNKFSGTLTVNSTSTMFHTTCTSGNQVLPIGILFDFKLQKEGASALLEWTVSDENEIDYFLVECSVNGFAFSELSTIMPDGRREYSYKDEKPVGNRCFYRIKIIGKNNTVRYSAVKQVAFQTAYSVSVYPQPAMNLLNVVVPSEWNGQVVQIRLFTTLGQLLTEQKVVAGKGVLQLPLRGLSAGMYYLNIKCNSLDKNETRTVFVE